MEYGLYIRKTSLLFLEVLFFLRNKPTGDRKVSSALFKA